MLPRASLRTFAATVCVLLLTAVTGLADEEITLFDGKSLTGWKPSKNSPEGTYKVADGVLQIRGGQGHLYYVGNLDKDGKAKFTFKNFEFTAKVKTYKGANSGIYFHTAYQDGGWPAAGYECQVNATHGDKKKTGGLYAVKDVMDTPAAPDDEWFDYRIRIEGKHIQIWINGKQTVDFTEPADWTPPKGMAGRKLATGTFALQAHDPGCKVDYKDIKVVLLP
jgi:hypothetical protein